MRGVWQLTLIAWAFFATLASAADEYVAGQTYFGQHDYIEYLAGNMPLVLSAPHGGREKPEEIPNRAAGTFAFDKGTQEIAREVGKHFQAQAGGWPHIIICRLHRTKVDCNREIVEAAAGNARAEQAWRDYQGFIEAARAAIVAQHGRGLYIDLHGHGHKEQRLEMGYLHTQAELQGDDAALNDPRFGAAGSLRAIAALNRLPYAQVVRGPLSFGTLMEKHGFPSTPSEATPKPPLPYFRGGYNTARHGRDGVPLAGLQIETNYTGVRDKPENHARFAQALYKSVDVYLEAHLGVRLKVAEPAAVPAAKEAASR
ncbi:MAG: hypothetical protein SFU86_21965 [Pirellulaceae bacterium]|nr:hypothetical protein [Pirellulaceae bacterium]